MSVLSSKHLTTIHDLTRDDIFLIFTKAMELKERLKRREPHEILRGKVLVMLFERPSLRTRVSFETAMTQLGGHSIYVKAYPRGSADVHLTEDMHDQAVVLSSYSDCIVIRSDEQRKIEKFAELASVPVINGLSDELHPCQIIADLFTILEEKGTLEGLRVAYFGDGSGNTAHSMLLGCAKLGIDICLSCPPEFPPKKKYLDWAREDAQTSGAELVIEHNPKKAAENADVIYTDAWEAESHELEFFRPYQVNQKTIDVAQRDVVILHCLPAIRGQEITSEVLDGPRSRIRVEAENRLHIQKAILTLLLVENS